MRQLVSPVFFYALAAKKVKIWRIVQIVLFCYNETMILQGGESMKSSRRLLAFLLVLLLLAAPAAAFADEPPYSVTLHIGTGSILVRARTDSFENNIYLCLSDLSAALSSTDKQFRIDYASNPTDGEYFVITSGQPAALPSGAQEGAGPFVDTLWPSRNRLFMDGRELKYYTHRSGNVLYMSLIDIQLLFDLTIERNIDGSLRVYPDRPFAPSIDALESEGFFDAFNAVVLGDAHTGEILYSWQPDRSFPIASLSKLMGYLLIAEAVNAGQIRLNDPVPISEKAEALSLSPDGQVKLHAGATVPLTELLDAMLLASSNESALALAEYLSGSEDAFVADMNARAFSLGLYSAVFRSPHGLPVYTQSSVPAKRQNTMSALEYFRLCAYLLANYPALTTRTSQQFVKLPTLEYTTANSNPMVFNMSGVNGLKTGNTTRAGYCLAASLPLSVGGQTHTILLVVLGAETAQMRNQASHILLRSAQRYYTDHGFAG